MVSLGGRENNHIWRINLYLEKVQVKIQVRIKHDIFSGSKLKIFYKTQQEMQVTT